MDTIRKIFHLSRDLPEFFADILFPKKAAVRRLEMMSAEEILRVVAKAKRVETRHDDGQKKGLFPLSAVSVVSVVSALFQYRDPLAKQIVWEIKYRGNTKLADMVGRLLCKRICEFMGFAEFAEFTRENFLLVPIPISARRLKQRGFSQTELIVKAVIKAMKENFSGGTKTQANLMRADSMRADFLYCPDILIKVKETPSQTSLGSRSKRLLNLSGAFALKNIEVAHGVREKNIILVDDVITTGATMNEASRVLMDAGAKSVSGFAIAH